MKNVNVRKDHSLGKDEARKRVAGIAESLCGKYGLQSSWSGDDLEISGSGVNGCIAVEDQAVEVNVKLGFALSMMEGTIRTSLEDAMDRHLA